MAASQVSKIAWLLEGDYFEGCNCDTVCPCIFFLDPGHVTSAWHIQKGNYGNRESKAALYIDERATKQQKDLITKIYSGQAGVYAAIKLKPVDNFILFLRTACQGRVLN